MTRLAIVDPGSFVLTYDHRLVEALSQAGAEVTFFGSRTRYNGELLEAMRRLPGVTVHAYDVSGSVAPRWRGLLEYLALWWRVWRERRRFDAVNLQFPVVWWFDALIGRLIGGLLGRLPGHRFVWTVHNAVPHDHAGMRHRATERLARAARTLIFPSRWSRDDFLARYGSSYETRAVVAPIGLSPATEAARVVPYDRAPDVRALVYWSTVKPYKGVELFADFAGDAAIAGRGIALEVWGRWDSSLAPLRATLQGLGVRVEDGYVDTPALTALLERRDAVFVLPYVEASQSGAMYTLLAHGAWFVATDVGDIGDFLRRHGLEALLLAERTPAAVRAALDRIAADRHTLVARLAAAQRAASWAEAARVYISAATTPAGGAGAT